MQQKLFRFLSSIEVVTLLLVMLILHVAIFSPSRWLAGDARDLGHCDFIYYDMGLVLDLIKDQFEEISNDGLLMLNEIYYPQ